MDEPNNAGSTSVPDDRAETPHRSRRREGRALAQSRRLAGDATATRQVLTYICVADGCDYQLSQTRAE